MDDVLHVSVLQLNTPGEDAKTTARCNAMTHTFLQVDNRLVICAECNRVAGYRQNPAGCIMVTGQQLHFFPGSYTWTFLIQIEADAGAQRDLQLQAACFGLTRHDT